MTHKTFPNNKLTVSVEVFFLVIVGINSLSSASIVYLITQSINQVLVISACLVLSLIMSVSIYQGCRVLGAVRDFALYYKQLFKDENTKNTRKIQSLIKRTRDLEKSMKGIPDPAETRRELERKKSWEFSAP